VAYLLDTNVFIEAANRYYAFDLCRGFWEWLDIANGDGRVISLVNVLDELLAGEDELSEWARARAGLFPRLRPDVGTHLGPLSRWARAGYYTDGAVATFLDAADYFLVATAVTSGDTVVTLERANRRPGRITIPDACIEMGVHFMTPFTMLKREHVQFELGAA